MAVENKTKKTKPKRSRLTPKQVLFVAEYLTDFNATRSAMAVGYSKNNAYYIGWELLQKTTVQNEIRRQTKLVADTIGLTCQRVLLEYLKIAFADITNYVDFGQKEVQAMNMFGPIYDTEEIVNPITGEKESVKVPVTKIVNFVDLKPAKAVDGSLISEVRQGREGVSIKLHDKMKALEKLEKYLDLLPDEHKRKIENERLKIDLERLELEKTKLNGPQEDLVDDGFVDAVDAMKAKAPEVWAGETDG